MHPILECDVEHLRKKTVSSSSTELMEIRRNAHHNINYAMAIVNIVMSVEVMLIIRSANAIQRHCLRCAKVIANYQSIES